SDDGVGTTPALLPPTAPGEDGYADDPERRPRLPDVPGLDDRPAEVAGVRVRTRGVAVLAARDTALAGLVEDGVAAALARKDPTLWGPEVAAEATARLGWLDLPESSPSLLPRLGTLRQELLAEGLDRVVLLGRGSSALAAETVAAAAGVDLVVVDTPDPARVRVALAEPRRTVVVVTPTTGPRADLESLQRALADTFRRDGASPEEVGRRFVAVAEPGSPLAETAAAAGFRAVLPTDPDIGDLFGALSAATLVPCALAGADCATLLDEAAVLLPTLADDAGPGLALGAALGGAGVSGRDKVVLAPEGDAAPGLARWVEALLGGSVGQEGRGLVPVVVESPDAPGTERQADTHLVLLGGPGGASGAGGTADPEHGTRVTGPLGAQLLLWEHATAVAARVLRADPFDQPDPRLAEREVAAVLADGAAESPPALVDGPVQVHDEGGLLGEAADLRSALAALLASVPIGGHLAVRAHLDRYADAEAARLRTALAGQLAHPVTFAWGPRPPQPGPPRQGAPPTDVHLQVTGEPADDLDVPERPTTFGRLQQAEALAEVRGLLGRGRPVLRLHLNDRRSGLDHLLRAVADDTPRGTAP
ncbi:MAG: hypothetical protein M3P95_09800, partial [Actinomycetota bacterium]|nr:hypothetical protein [Actinomycetota bacterium]